MIRLWLYSILTFAGIAAAHADPIAIQALHERVRELRLHQSNEWHNLLHYRKNFFGSGYTSFADGADFFLAATGKTDPLAELEATLAAIATPQQTGKDDEQAQCRFVARTRWLKQQLQLADTDLPRVNCAAFNEWYSTVNPAGVTLVFPSAYINNPSSMFGHTLLRIDPPVAGKTKTPLTSYSISYAAETTEFNGLIFAIRGLAGGYAGYFSIAPYYGQVNEYSDLENRDIWEYELDFTPLEVQRLMEHTWEIHRTAFDYFFLDENCSFQLLTLLDVARPGMFLAAAFPLEVIPTDTVRAVLQQNNILRRVSYRPASRTNLTHWIDQLAAQQQNWLLAYTTAQTNLQDARFIKLAMREQANLLDVAYEYVQYQYRRHNLSRTDSASKSLELLTQRSKLPDTQPLIDAPPPLIRPDQGHLSSRVQLGIGTLSDTAFAQITWRPAYHDLLDDDSGHVAGSQINFLDLSLRVNEQTQQAKLEKFALLDIFSVTPTTPFFSSLSWHFDTGFERLPIDVATTHRKLAYTTNIGAGFTQALSADLRVYGLIDGSVIVHDQYEDNLAAGVGLRVGGLTQLIPKWKLQFEARVLDLSYHENRVLQSLLLGTSISFDQQNALRFYWERSGTKEQLQTTLLLSWHHYYQ